MPIQMTISGEDAFAFLADARAVLSGMSGYRVVTAAPGDEQRVADKVAAENPGCVVVTPESNATEPAPPNATEVVRALRDEDDSALGLAPPAPEPPKRGRPRKTAEAKPATFTVRRYGGMIEGEYTDSGEAAEVLVGLIQAAADEQALDELMKHNAEDMLAWPKERTTDVLECVDAVRAVLKSGEIDPLVAELKPVAAPPARVHNDLNGNPLTEVDVTAIPGVMAALNAFCAMDDGTPQGPHYQKARAHMDSLGIVTVRKLDPAKPEDMAKLRALGTWCAEGLGLPVAGAGGLL